MCITTVLEILERYLAERGADRKKDKESKQERSEIDGVMNSSHRGLGDLLKLSLFSRLRHTPSARREVEH